MRVRSTKPSSRLAGGLRGLIAPLSALGPLFALLLACAYFASQTDGS